MSEDSFAISIRLIDKFMFEIDFGEFGDLITDEPPPLGEGEGPNPSQLLAAAVANCLCASLLFAVRKFKEDPGEIKANVTGLMTRINKRLRIEKIQVDIYLSAEQSSIQHLERAVSQFENFCVVTESVRNGIEVDVAIYDGKNEKVPGKKD
ncbi:hypothetical protein NBRC116493_04510 [Aurantivibrio infirmus]